MGNHLQRLGIGIGRLMYIRLNIIELLISTGEILKNERGIVNDVRRVWSSGSGLGTYVMFRHATQGSFRTHAANSADVAKLDTIS